jgi:NAD(P)H-flavin reductase
VNIYQPQLTLVTELTEETQDTRTLRLEFKDEAVRDSFDFHAGQFGEYSVFGAGESTFCIASAPTRKGFIECSFKAVGKVTSALREVNVGDTVGFRGPYGNWFPVDDWKGKDVVFIAGGIGLAPVRCVIWNVLDRRDEFGDVTIVYGARSVGDLVYKRELEEWASRSDVKIVTTVDPGGRRGDGAEGAERRRRALRAAHRRQAHAARARQARLRRRRHLHHPREPHEVRPRQVRPLQHRARVRLQGRARLHRRADEGAPRRVLRSGASRVAGAAPIDSASVLA